MAEVVDPTPSDSAEKAYAAAAELAIAQADAVKAEPAADLQFPAKPKRAAAPAAEVKIPAELEADLVMKAKPVAARKAAAAKKPVVAKEGRRSQIQDRNTIKTRICKICFPEICFQGTHDDRQEDH